MKRFYTHIISILFLLLSSLVYAQTYYVSTNGNNSSGNGTQNNPWRTITFALTQVDTLTVNIKTIFVSSGIYSRDTNGEEFPLNLVSNLILKGEDSANTILDAKISEFVQVNRRVINCIAVNSTRIENFTITGGKAIMDASGNFAVGGGIYISNSEDIEIRKNIIKENEASDGTGWGASAGGIYVLYSNKILIAENQILDNFTIADGCGGGGISVSWSKVLIRDNIINDNEAWGLFGSDGGGVTVSNWEDSTYIVSNIIKSNKASTHGGGIYFSSQGIIARNIITENIVGEEDFHFGTGGGISVHYHPCVISGGSKNSNYVFGNISEISNQELGTQIITSDLEENIDARFNYWGSNTNPNDTTQIFGDLDIEPLVNEVIEPNSNDLIISPSPVVIDTNLMSGIYKQKINFYNVSKSLSDSIEVFSITSKKGLVDISRANFIIDAISEDSVSFTFNVNEIISNIDTINVTTSEGNFLITFYILGEDTTTGINQNSIDVPAQYELSQNYPNPFNSSTKIRYSIPTTDFVQIKLYDILGREIQTLLNDYKSAGIYEVEFSTNELPSGVYFYKMLSGDYSKINKMILLK